MTRLSKEELEKVKKKYNVSRLWSFSRINKFMTSPYEYFLQYVLKKNPDRSDSIYAPLGSVSHDCIERFYNGELDHDGMLNEFEDAWTTYYDISNMKFDRSDEEKNKNIADRYKKNMVLFFKNHKRISNKVALEKFLVTKIGSHVLQGYCDACYKDDDGNFVIVDWKTSSKYSGKTLEEKSGQLCVYSMALMQSGVPIDKIKAAFNFLKYCTVKYEQSNGAVKSRDVERGKLGESIKANCKMWLGKLGYNDSDIKMYLESVLETNDINVLPEDVRSKYSVEDCYVYIQLDEKMIDEWTSKINLAIADIYAREHDYEDTHSDKAFWDDEESVKKESYYFANLCSFSANMHLPYKKYLDELEAKENGTDMFGSLGANDAKSSNVVSDSDDDLSWLDELL